MTKRFHPFLLILVVLLTVSFWGLTENVIAAPGGIIKEVARTFWGRLILIGVFLILAPLLTWYFCRRWLLIRKVRQTLRELANEYPQFEWMVINEKITEVFYWVHSAWDQKKMEIADHYMTDWYRQNQQLILDKWERDGLENIVSDVQIKKITPLFISYNPDQSNQNRLVVEIDAELRDYLVEKTTRKVVKGDKTLGQLITVWTFVWGKGRWILNMIEPEEMAMDYLQEPDLVPSSAKHHLV